MTRDEDDRWAGMACDGPHETWMSSIPTGKVARTDAPVSDGSGADSSTPVHGLAEAPIVPAAGQETEPEQLVPTSEALVEGDVEVQEAGEADAGVVIARELGEAQRVKKGGGSASGLVKVLRRSIRVPGSSGLNSPCVVDLLHKIRTNDAAVEVLKGSRRSRGENSSRR